MQRHFARKGDKTTTDGTILEGDDGFIQGGLPVAFHGAKVYCPACNSAGAIHAVPPCHPFSVNGKQIALEGDLCVCKCSSPPKLIASQSSGRMTFEASDGDAMMLMETSRSASIATAKLTSEQFATDAETTLSNANYDQHFILKNERSGAPLTDTPYKIETEDGNVIEGRTDSSGRTQIVPGQSALTAIIHVLEDHPPLNPNWDRHT